MADTSAPSRPQTVLAAMAILVALLAFELPSLLTSILSTALFIVVLQAAALHKLYRGRKWGPILLAVVAGFGALNIGLRLVAVSTKAQVPFDLLVRPAEFLLAELVALALVFLPASRDYFTKCDPRAPVDSVGGMVFLSLLLAILGACGGMLPALHHKFTGPSADTAFNAGQFELLFAPAVFVADIIVAVIIARKKLPFRQQCGIAFLSGFAPHILASLAVML